MKRKPKNGMQRELLVAYWLLFDELPVGGGVPVAASPADGLDSSAEHRDTSDEE